MLATIDTVKGLVASGKSLILAGDESLLRTLPRGNWIGGTIPYFMAAGGGLASRSEIFVEEVPAFASAALVAVYESANISEIGTDSPDNGYTIVIIPAFSALHTEYALNAPEYPELFMKIVAGWIAGVHLDDVATTTPLVFDGRTGKAFHDRAVAMHVALPPGLRGEIGIVNLFEPGDGDTLRFPTSGFDIEDCSVNGQRRNFHDYLVERKVDTRLPFVTEANGVNLAVSIQALDAKTRRVKLYAPVFAEADYHVAKPIGSYPERFAAAIPKQIHDVVFACNCVLNYVYGELEGKRTGGIVGPMTFGEIAFQLLNQTLVYITVGPS